MRGVKRSARSDCIVSTPSFIDAARAVFKAAPWLSPAVAELPMHQGTKSVALTSARGTSSSCSGPSATKAEINALFYQCADTRHSPAWWAT
jgi:hypothetical protein